MAWWNRNLQFLALQHLCFKFIKRPIRKEVKSYTAMMAHDSHIKTRCFRIAKLTSSLHSLQKLLPPSYFFLPLPNTHTLVLLSETEREIKWRKKNKNNEKISLTACCNQISYSTTLKESTVLDRWKQKLGNHPHFPQTNSHYCSLTNKWE